MRIGWDLASLNRKCAFFRSLISVDLYKWDVTNLPLKDNSVDVFITDLVSIDTNIEQMYFFICVEIHTVHISYLSIKKLDRLINMKNPQADKKLFL